MFHPGTKIEAIEAILLSGVVALRPAACAILTMPTDLDSDYLVMLARSCNPQNYKKKLTGLLMVLYLSLVRYTRWKRERESKTMLK